MNLNALKDEGMRNMNQSIFKQDLAGHSKDLIPIIQRGYLTQGIKYSREEVYEDLLTLWVDVYGRRAEKESVFEKTSRVLGDDIEEYIIGPLEEMTESNPKKNLMEEAQKLVTKSYGEEKEEIYKLIIKSIIPEDKRSRLDYEQFIKIYEKELLLKRLLPWEMQPLTENKKEKIHTFMQLIEKGYNSSIDFVEGIEKIQEIHPVKEHETRPLGDKNNQLIIRRMYEQIFSNMLQAFSIGLKDSTSEDIWDEAAKIISRFPRDVFAYEGTNNTSPKWIINRIKEIIFATEGVKEKQFKKQLDFLKIVRNSWFGYWVEVLKD